MHLDANDGFFDLALAALQLSFYQEAQERDRPSPRKATARKDSIESLPRSGKLARRGWHPL
jgi:hypothetical protein